MKVAVGSDHKGLKLKEHIKDILDDMSIEYRDLGTFSEQRVDYPDFARGVGWAVARGECDCGIVICATGVGVSMTANRVPGVRAALCGNVFLARGSRRHNNANVLCLGALSTGEGLAGEIVRVWLTTAYDGGRHQGRLDKMAELELECAHWLLDESRGAGDGSS